MPDVTATRNPAPVFAALGDPTRLALLGRLSGGESCSIATLSADGIMTRQAVTKHLHVLEEAGLVESIRIGRESRYSFRPEPVAAACAYLEAVAAQWEGALERLKRFVEKDG